ncbi:MAG: hypothetical protein HKN25_08260 [Pyrinomonadaceae bacterium]|nr:hypothetical protein [Pyrinomonadaceae bacterium]
MNYFNYFTEIEETFIRRRGKHLMLSPLDWAMVESWKERGIPLRIAIRAIEDVFDRVDKKPNKARSIKSLSYCREEVEAQYEEWLSAQVGKTSDQDEADSAEPDDAGVLSVEETATHLRTLLDSLSKAKADGELHRVLDRVAAKLERMIDIEADAKSVERSLGELEKKIDRALLKNTDSDALSLMNKNVKSDLSEYETKMEKDVYERTFELMLLKKLREEANIPRLSLFFL